MAVANVTTPINHTDADMTSGRDAQNHLRRRAPASGINLLRLIRISMLDWLVLRVIKGSDAIKGAWVRKPRRH